MSRSPEQQYDSIVSSNYSKYIYDIYHAFKASYSSHKHGQWRVQRGGG